MEKETKAQRVERIKKEKDGLDVLEDILYYVNNKDQDVDDETIERLKWYGIYLQRNHDLDNTQQHFMLRVKLVSGEVSYEQLLILITISQKYAQSTASFTTRQDIQFHNISIDNILEIFKLLNSVGLNSINACGDCPRNTVTCPASYSQSSLIDTKKLTRQINDFFTNNKDFSNLPRKFKIGINSCTHHCIYHEIQDVGFTAFIQDDEVLFDITVGGGLSGGKQIAKRLGFACIENQVLEISKGCAMLFKLHGNRTNRAKARMRHLVEDWGVEKFLEELKQYINFELIPSVEPKIANKYKRNHIGLERQKDGLFSLGCSTNSGRMREDGLLEIRNIMEKYKIFSFVVTTTQDFILQSILPKYIDGVLSKVNRTFSTNPSPFRVGMVSCTGKEFCKFAISETKSFAKELVSYLEENVEKVPENINIHIAGCNNSCSHPQIADIGLIATFVRDESKKRVEGYEVFFGGNMKGVQSTFAQKTSIKLPKNEIYPFIKSTIDNYQASETKKTLNSYLLEQIG